MRFQVGDLVSAKKNGKIGFIFEVSKANSSSLGSSLHSLEHLRHSFDVYYVFFPGLDTKIPLYGSELSLIKEKNATTVF